MCKTCDDYGFVGYNRRGRPIPCPTCKGGARSRGRAYRRAQQEKMKRRVVGYYGGYMLPQPAAPHRELNEEERARHVGLSANTKHRCSCYGCGNPRRHFKGKARLTMQERKMGVAVALDS